MDRKGEVVNHLSFIQLKLHAFLENLWAWSHVSGALVFERSKLWILFADYWFFGKELDWESIAAGLLHDTVEDTKVVTFERIEKEFGAAVRHIVEGETKVLVFLEPYVLHLIYITIFMRKSSA